MKTLGLLFAFGFAASTGTVINFDTAPLGKTPPGWTVAQTHRGGAPQWEIRRDQTAATQPYVLAQVSSDATNDRFPLAIFDSLNLRDGDVSVRIKPVTGRGDRGGGLVWRYKDENNYYLVQTNAIERNVQAFKVQDGRRIPLLSGVTHEIPTNAWTILKVSARGNRFQVYLDHRRILQGQDSTFSGPGKVGLCTEGDSVTYFDDFRVYPR
ncbi:MAG TPA: hypothetical protein VGH38_18585 [Bryobacteraceae bacterium]|jgi:hypothetical protein